MKRLLILLIFIAFASICLIKLATTIAQNIKGGKKISDNMFGLLFHDINYVADGGLYAEMIQNRSFEHTPAIQPNYNPFLDWQFISPGFSMGNMAIETTHAPKGWE